VRNLSLGLYLETNKVERREVIMPVDGFEPYKPEDVERYVKYRWWPGITWGDVFDKATDLYPEKEALVDDTARFTYKELREKVDRLAISFIELGIRERDFVLLQLPNWHEFVLAFFALQKAGAIVVLLIARHGLAEINYLCSLTHPVAWIGPARYKNTDYLPMLKSLMESNKDLQHLIAARARENQAFIPLERLIDAGKLTATNIEALAARRPDPMEVCIVIPTGGTTGLPKAVPRTHDSYLSSIEYHGAAWELTCQDVILTVAPVSHGQGMQCGLGGSFFNRAKFVLSDSTQPEDICRIIEQEKVTAFPTVPAVVQRIVTFEKLKEYDLSSLKKIYAGGAPSTPELVKSVYQTLGCKYVNAFGSVEGSGAMTRLDADFETVCTTVGKKDCPYNRFKIIDQYEQEVPPNGEGELTTKGPIIFSGYFKSPDVNAITFTQDGFFKTGDLAKIDENGIITITGRIKETILRGGETISAVGIERLVSSHPSVAEVAVIGMPDQAIGERICAYIKLKPGVSLAFEELIAYLRSIGASVMQLPERVEFIDAIPLTNVGKADKKALKEDIKKKLGVG
jgi:2,3-dihydroxybenzoate-AMP ligase